MRKLIMTCGNIGTGKSTTVRELTKTMKPGTYFVWNVDSIAQSLSHGIYDKDIWTEDHQWVYNTLKETLIEKSFFIPNITVILDDCHMSRVERIKWVELAASHGFSERQLIVHKSAHNVENRMNEPRGYNRELWQKVSQHFAEQWTEPMDDEGFTSIRYEEF